jgi:hypothetical protein
MTLPAHGLDPPDPGQSLKLRLDLVQGERSLDQISRQLEQKIDEEPLFVLRWMIT